MLNLIKFVLLDKAHLNGEDPKDHIGSHRVNVNEGSGYNEVLVNITPMDVKRYWAEKVTYYPH